MLPEFYSLERRYLIDTETDGKWVCSKCGEFIESQFDACWQCQTSRESIQELDDNLVENSSLNRNEIYEEQSKEPIKDNKSNYIYEVVSDRLLQPVRGRFNGSMLFVYAFVLFCVVHLFGKVAGLSTIIILAIAKLVTLKLSYYSSVVWSAKDALDVLAKDDRPPILLLRPFAFDYFTTEMEWYLQSYFEKAVGPTVAVGRPGERYQALGASRMYLRKEKWQDVVLDLMKRARLVIVFVGDGDGLWWEIEQLTKLQNPEKIVLYFPAKDFDYSNFRSRVGSIFPKILPGEIQKDSFIFFKRDWEVRILQKRHRSLKDRIEDHFLDRDTNYRTFAPVLNELGFSDLKPNRCLSAFRILKNIFGYLLIIVVIGGYLLWMLRIDLFHILLTAVFETLHR